MTLPPRKSDLKMGVREDYEKKRRHPNHTKWVRGFCCCVLGCDNRNTQAAHVSWGYPEGTPEWQKAAKSSKAHDKFTVSLCVDHHGEQHTTGAQTFERKYGVDLPALAQEFAQKSPHRKGWQDD